MKLATMMTAQPRATISRLRREGQWVGSTADIRRGVGSELAHREQLRAFWRMSQAKNAESPTAGDASYQSEAIYLSALLFGLSTAPAASIEEKLHSTVPSAQFQPYGNFQPPLY